MEQANKFKQFEQPVTPEQEREYLEKRIAESPEKGREILKEHAQLKPEEIYGEENKLSSQELSGVEKRVTDVHYREKETALGYLFEIANEKGILNAVKLAEKLDPALQDEFHDRLVQQLSLNK